MANPQHRPERRVGPYRIRRRLGSGGMGVVYLGHHEVTGAPAAVKLLRPEHAADPTLRARLRREVDAARRIPRSCTAPVLDADLDTEPHWVATEYIDGPTLEALLLDHRRLAGAALEAFATGVAVALRAIHAHGVIHRDLKPTNVLLSPLGPRVIDFGIARIMPADSQLTQLTQPGTVVGTPAYMAPEQLRGEPLTPAVDIFAWASLVTHAATGRPPFGTGTPAIAQILFTQPDLAGLPEPLRDLVTAAFKKAPTSRPTAAALVEQLSQRGTEAATQVLATAGVPGSDTPESRAPDRTPPAPGASPATGRRRGRLLVAGLAAVAALALVAVIVGAIVRPGRELPLAGETITIGVFHGWQEGIAASFIWRAAFEAQGAEVVIRFGDAAVIYSDVGSGELDLAFDAWLPATHASYWEAHGDTLEDLGAWYTEAALTIAVNEDAPIRSLTELAGAADEFGNRLVGIESDAGLTQTVANHVRPAYGLEDMHLAPSSTGEMLAELRSAIERGDNIVVTLWEPHWAYNAYPIRNLTDPANALATQEQIHAFARLGFSDQLPLAAGWVRDFTMHPDELNSLVQDASFHGRQAPDEEYERAVQDWLDRHPGYLTGLTTA